MGLACIAAAAVLLPSVVHLSSSVEALRVDGDVRHHALLKELATEYTESEAEIARETDDATTLLNGFGQDEGQLAILERMHRVAGTVGMYDKYAATLAMYVDLRRKGASSDEAASTIGRIDTWMERWPGLD